MKRILSFIVLAISMHFPYACIEDDCGEFAPLESRITALATTIGSVENNEFSDQVSNAFSAAAVQIEISEMEFTRISFKQSDSILPRALACSPPEPVLAYVIEGITITAESSILSGGNILNSGESLNELFVVTEGDLTIESFVKRTADLPSSFNYVGASFTIRLKDQPDQVIDQKLLIKLNFSDGSSLTIETSNFEAG